MQYLQMASSANAGSDTVTKPTTSMASLTTSGAGLRCWSASPPATPATSSSSAMLVHQLVPSPLGAGLPNGKGYLAVHGSLVDLMADLSPALPHVLDQLASMRRGSPAGPGSSTGPSGVQSRPPALEASPAAVSVAAAAAAAAAASGELRRATSTSTGLSPRLELGSGQGLGIGGDNNRNQGHHMPGLQLLTDSQIQQLLTYVREEAKRAVQPVEGGAAAAKAMPARQPQPPRPPGAGYATLTHAQMLELLQVVREEARMAVAGAVAEAHAAAQVVMGPLVSAMRDAARQAEEAAARQKAMISDMTRRLEVAAASASAAAATVPPSSVAEDATGSWTGGVGGGCPPSSGHQR